MIEHAESCGRSDYAFRVNLRAAIDREEVEGEWGQYDEPVLDARCFSGRRPYMREPDLTGEQWLTASCCRRAMGLRAHWPGKAQT